MPDFVIIPDANSPEDFTGAVFASGDTPLTLSGLTIGSTYRAYLLSQASPSFTPQETTQVETSWVRADGTQTLVHPAVAGNVTQVTFAALLRPNQASQTRNIFHITGRSTIRQAGSALSIVLKDDANNIAFSAELPDVFVVGEAVHVYIAADFANNTLQVELNGAPVSSNPDLSTFNAPSGLTDLDREMSLLGGFDGDVASLFLDAALIDNTALWQQSGQALEALTPLVLFGGGQAADALSGDATKGWNSGFNRGTGGVFTVTGELVDA